MIEKCHLSRCLEVSKIQYRHEQITLNLSQFVEQVKQRIILYRNKNAIVQKVQKSVPKKLVENLTRNEEKNIKHNDDFHIFVFLIT